MRLTRIHVAMPLASGSEIDLPDGAATHLARVLRLGVGDTCLLFNGDGNDYAARIVAAAGKRGLRVAIESALAVDRESPLRLVLLQGIARGEKMDMILQKATELGVSAVLPLSSQRSEVKLDDSRGAKRLAHWQSVVVAACEQSGRARVPTVGAPGTLAAVLAGLPEGGTRLLLDPDGGLSMPALTLPSATPVLLAVGPEGGWSPLDREQLAAAGFQGLRLGPRVLRTETAGLAAIAALQARFGDLG